jgi:predicted SAM-dependent methyltransferase
MDINLGCGQDASGYGIDIDPESRADLIADIHAIPLPDNVASLIRCYEVLEHLRSPQEAIKEMARLLEPGGILIITVPNLLHILGILRFMKSGRLTVAKEHIQGFRVSELVNLGERAGLTSVLVDYMTHSHYHKSRWYLSLLPSRLKNFSLRISFTKKC